MPVSLLLVEGDLDAQLLAPILAGRPTVEAAKASKNALAPRVRTERTKGNPGVYYLRDRDFDCDPPEDPSAPVIDRQDQDSKRPLGWRWSRHAIENYMLDPSLAATVAGRDEVQYAASVFRDRVGPTLGEETLRRDFGNYNKRFADPAFQNASNVLLWFSGKDIAAALTPWLTKCGFSSAGDFRARVRDWMISHSEIVLASLAEWRALVDALNQE